MRLNQISKYVKDGRVFLSAEVESASFQAPQTLFFSYPGEFYHDVPSTADPFLPALLIPAMFAAEPLEIIPPVSSKMLKHQSTIQSVFCSWYPEVFSKVQVIARERVRAPAADRATAPRPNATFFSLGVDSMYTMLKYHPKNCSSSERQVSTLIFMKGLELPLSIYEQGQDQEVINSIRELAGHYGLKLLVGETNIRDVFPLDWLTHYSGPGLAATALSLSEGFGHVYIPSSHSYANLSPNSSSPLVDNLWSNEKLAIVHDGSEVERAEKIANLIVKDQYATDHLRVCISNLGGNYNCGKCWKCVRTMVTLQILGRLKQAASFPDELPENYSLELRTYNRGALKYAAENLKLARAHGHYELQRILEREIRVGQLDVFRNGRSVSYLLREMAHYLMIKAGRKLRLLPWKYTHQ